ncbi:MAG: retroviral-like aspartic protease family protein [Oscillospiraceae bacterium]|nr:retroviral-like aspartic protease family protein [Oscillospiraceae bacterium]
MEKLGITTINDLIYTDILFWNVSQSKYQNIIVMVDTGAKTTTFSDSTLSRLGYLTNSKPITVRTGGGDLTASEVKIPKLKVGNIELNDIIAHSNGFLDNYKIDGILGMNVLRLFNFSVDFDENVVTLKRRI